MVEWEDSAQPVPAWRWVKDYGAPEIVRCTSVGWLIHDGDDVKALAPNMGEIGDDLQVSGVIRIPTRCVARIVGLEEAGS